MKKVLFLDIDGVLNSHKYEMTLDSEPQGMVIDRAAIQTFNEILEIDPEIKVVISSSWVDTYSLMEFVELLENQYGILKDRIVDVISSDMEKAKAIRQWIDKNQPEQVCVLDDDWIFSLNDPLQENFVKLSGYEGLRDKHIDVILSQFI